ncbi:MAG: AMP-binding protein [Puniceicoccales bacterium]|jgi:acyl-CoA synthetase (AMP-forming)/AMP-acid ligase II|nr:AMP-binding protein [Puniceicoccales bacterium]
MPTGNVTRHLRRAAQDNPEACAVRVPCGTAPGGAIRYISRSFVELDRESDAAAEHFQRSGIAAGMRTLLLARPGLDLILSMFALLKLGAVPVAIDPGLGLRPFLRCVRNIAPRALVGTPFALVLASFFPGTFRDATIRVRIGGGAFARVLRRIAPTLPGGGRPLFDATLPGAVGSAPAAILFTSGSTGAPKGATYTHAMLDAQLALVRDTYGIQPREVDLPMLPIFALFNPALGTTTVTPEMNPSRPATVDPRKIIRAITQNGVTYSFGSPALWAKIACHCERHRVALPSLRRILIAGAPVPARLLQRLQRIFPNATLHTPYGATEVLPVATITATEILGGTVLETCQGRGTCVGRPLRGVSVKIIPIHDGPLRHLDEAGEMPRGGVGEIIVNSPSCSHEYAANPDATALAKIHAPDGKIWHRMGDLGRLDAAGRLWFYGRKAERVQTSGATLCTESVEAVFNQHPRVFRTALIGLGEPGQQTPALVIEPHSADFPRNAAARLQFEGELREWAKTCEATRVVEHFFFEKKFPVDPRHNAKIHRLALRKKYMRG